MHDLANPGSPLSRRTLITRMGWGSAAMLATTSLVVARVRAGDAAPASFAASSPEDDDALLARIVSGPKPFIPRRETPYCITRTLPIEGGRTVLIEPGTRIVWNGAARDPLPAMPVFEAMGDDVVLSTAGDAEVFIECETPQRLIYAVAMSGRRGLSVIGIQARNCQHVYVGSTAADHETVRTSGPDANVAREVRIQGGGARYEAMSPIGQGACMLSYVVGAHVSDVHYENVNHGIEWWGGNANPAPDSHGARANERKCAGLLIERVSVKTANGAGIWGSMGRAVTVRDCQVEDCLDVGFDAEGCDETIFERCTARNGHNGCFTAFFLNNGIRFVDCRGIVDDRAWPLFRIYNATQSNADNRNIAVYGGRFECLDPTGPGTMDCAMGPVRELAITGATLTNVRIDTVFLNMHHTRIADNELTFPQPLPSVPAIRAGTSQGLPGEPGEAIVENNRIRYLVPPRQAAAAGEPVAVELVENDFNSNAQSKVLDNVISGPFALGIALVNASGNIGIVPAFEVSGNRFERLEPSAWLLGVERRGPQASAPAVHWDESQTRDGKTVSQARAQRPGIARRDGKAGV